MERLGQLAGAFLAIICKRYISEKKGLKGARKAGHCPLLGIVIFPTLLRSARSADQGGGFFLSRPAFCPCRSNDTRDRTVLMADVSTRHPRVSSISIAYTEGHYLHAP